MAEMKIYVEFANKVLSERKSQFAYLIQRLNNDDKINLMGMAVDEMLFDIVYDEFEIEYEDFERGFRDILKIPGIKTKFFTFIYKFYFYIHDVFFLMY